ncbi:peroxidase family protein [Thiothrix subterranea]|uniref:Peroxidase family protein n=1 Tax=Thiothrix subterranea TaxID=2735563 RepID=A0AA51R0Z1_9GAMM|nr:peroxidase family protein [Thiothrix subterranea]MDQ5768915.1 peroxidase family protein [Thiothrix subterranea]WML86169.1 peroxidase family protein [Thiothrix subterranea]
MQTINNYTRSSSQGYGRTESTNKSSNASLKMPAVNSVAQWSGYNGGNKNIFQSVANLIQQLLAQIENKHNPKPQPQPQPAEYRSVDGTGNNKKNPTWGSAGIQHQRRIPQDSSREPGGSTEQKLPNPRTISNAVAAQDGANTVNQKGLSDLFWMWGQFLDHDMTETPTNTAEKAPIAIPAGDPQFDPEGTGTVSIQLSRSAATLDANGQRQQSNNITAFIDGSNVYGSDAEYASKLRTHEGGKLQMSAGDMMPMENGQFMAGDIRSNENIGLTSMHTLWVREHNRLADEIAQKNPKMSDEQIYQEARKVNVAQMQAITYNEFLPNLIGKDAIPKYTGYKSNVDPSIDNAFATAAFRMGHTMLSPNLLRLDENGETIEQGNVALRDAFFRPDKVMESGIDPILRGAASQTAQAVDPMIVDDVRNFLFPQGGLDLAAVNIQRGRDHGLAGYGDTRQALGLRPVNSFDSNVWREGFGEKLASVYDKPADVDLWVAGLAEKPVGDSLFGQTFTKIMSDQFTRLRDGDRFWYENQFSGKELQAIKNTKLSDIIERNTDFDNVQKNAFVASNAHLA